MIRPKRGGSSALKDKTEKTPEPRHARKRILLVVAALLSVGALSFGIWRLIVNIKVRTDPTEMVINSFNLLWKDDIQSGDGRKLTNALSKEGTAKLSVSGEYEDSPVDAEISLGYNVSDNRYSITANADKLSAGGINLDKSSVSLFSDLKTLNLDFDVLSNWKRYRLDMKKADRLEGSPLAKTFNIDDDTARIIGSVLRGVSARSDSEKFDKAFEKLKNSTFDSIEKRGKVDVKTEQVTVKGKKTGCFKITYTFDNRDFADIVKDFKKNYSEFSSDIGVKTGEEILRLFEQAVDKIKSSNDSETVCGFYISKYRLRLVKAEIRTEFYGEKLFVTSEISRKDGVEIAVSFEKTVNENGQNKRASIDWIVFKKTEKDKVATFILKSPHGTLELIIDRNGGSFKLSVKKDGKSETLVKGDFELKKDSLTITVKGKDVKDIPERFKKLNLRLKLTAKAEIDEFKSKKDALNFTEEDLRKLVKKAIGLRIN